MFDYLIILKINVDGLSQTPEVIKRVYPINKKINPINS